MNIHPAGLSEQQLVSECDITRTRRGGPGGQHRNKVDSAIVITHRPSGVSAQAGERRSQHANKAVALQRLRVNLAVQLRTLRTSDPSELWESRCVSGRIAVNPKHRDFPVLLAEALDQIYQNQLQLPVAAKALGCTSSQLIKFVKIVPAAFSKLNRERAKIDLTPLR